jgi:hypothetical protein
MQAMYRRPTMPKPKPKQRPNGALDLMAAEFHDKPFGSSGETIIPRKSETPPAPPPRGLVIEPPPWAGQVLPPLADTPSVQPNALEEIKRANGDDEWPAPPGPPMVTQPLIPLAIPEADWREEERLRREQSE